MKNYYSLVALDKEAQLFCNIFGSYVRSEVDFEMQVEKDSGEFKKLRIIKTDGTQKAIDKRITELNESIRLPFQPTTARNLLCLQITSELLSR